MLKDILPAAISALIREAELIAQALTRVTEAGPRRDALMTRAAALDALKAGISEKPTLSALREAAIEIERIGRRLSANAQNAEEGAKLLTLAQDLVIRSEAEADHAGDTDIPAEAEVVAQPAAEETLVVADLPAEEEKASVEDAAPSAEEEIEVQAADAEAPKVDAPVEASNEPPESQEVARVEQAAAPLSKPETMDVKMTQISKIEAVTDLDEDGALPEETTEESSGKKSDEALAGAWMAQNMSKMNKVARNRYGDGKEVCLVANRSASRDQRNVIANLPAEALDWARSARRPVKLVLFIRYPEDTAAGTAMRVVTTTMTTAVALATPGKAAKATISLWDEFGDVEKANGVLACEGSAENALTDIQVVSAVIA